MTRLLPGRGLAAVVLAVGLLLGTGIGTAAELVTHHAVRHPGAARDGLITILVIGSDVGPPSRPGDPLRGRGDTLQLVAVDADRRTATIVSIPRDSLAQGRKVNGHLATGGPDQQVRAVESLSGVDIDYWVLTSFLGFRRMVDTLGGVDIAIERPMVDRNAKSSFPTPGEVRVDGTEALSFVRDRGSMPDGDIGRTRNGGRFLRFTHREVRRQQPSLRALGRMTSRFAEHSASNIPPEQLLPLALLALEIDPGDVRHDALSGRIGSAGGASVIFLRPGRAFERIRDGEVGP